MCPFGRCDWFSVIIRPYIRESSIGIYIYSFLWTYSSHHECRHFGLSYFLEKFVLYVRISGVRKMTWTIFVCGFLISPSCFNIFSTWIRSHVCRNILEKCWKWFSALFHGTRKIFLFSTGQQEPSLFRLSWQISYSLFLIVNPPPKHRNMQHPTFLWRRFTFLSFH